MFIVQHNDSNARRSRFTIADGIVFCSGNVANTRPASIGVQTQQVLDKIDKELALAGTNKTKILFVQIFLADIERDFAGMNAVWDTWTDPERAPARATVEAKMANPDLLVEMVVTAAL
ncbi:RidA family protein [Paraburkholderia caledonica]|uniref:Enamine deaminase RidA (YjgF/YER057c/UK114 family) n=1 Tax=Paraburkholderia caledonica TaxID=134536 RepID=A0AB73IMJ8_9BURK|nr:enamine deaminase RidA (YjgF/YER057c/UK114 family) [Paraburkholderia caledonica]